MRLDRKLFWSYIITILIAISTSFTLFTVTSNQFLSYRLLDSMKKEMDLIQENFNQVLSFVITLCNWWSRS